MSEQSAQQRYQQRQQRIKKNVDQRIASANILKGIIIVYTGNGKGKSSAAFGTAVRSLGHGLKAAACQFIKGTWESGERIILQQLGMEFQVMATGFTWETENKESNIQAALRVWQESKRMLSDPSLSLVILDELTYMISYGYIELEEVLNALQQRPAMQTVIITGRGCHRKLLELADTVTEMRPVKHAFECGIQAQKGIDW